MVQPDGKILIGGSFTTDFGATRNRIARPDPDGTLDTGFNPNPGALVNTIAVQADGKILVGGNFSTIYIASDKSFHQSQFDFAFV